jgi:sensor domain CHASE-containing protein
VEEEPAVAVAVAVVVAVVAAVKEQAEQQQAQRRVQQRIQHVHEMIEYVLKQTILYEVYQSQMLAIDFHFVIEQHAFLGY